MHNYQQQPLGYQRPGSTASFHGQPGTVPPPYGVVNQGYQPATPQQQSAQPQQQWAQSPQTQQGGWGGQQQPHVGGYNPGVYGAMPGAYAQGQPASVNQPSNPYTQQQDQPPPPPPKPLGFGAPQQQQPAQQWGQQQYGAQPSHVQSGYPQQYQPQVSLPYNTTAPPPPSATPGGSYFPPGQTPAPYGSDQTQIQGEAYTSSTPASATTAQPPNSVLSPDAQHPTYIPPSLTGQGVQSYMPVNTNPMPGVYVPPPPDMPAWQQASHAPLQGGNKKFRYTKPSVDPSFVAQGYQAPVQQVQQPVQYAQQPVPGQYGQPVQHHFQGHGQDQILPPTQHGQLQDQLQQQQQHAQPQGILQQSGQQQYLQQGNQWQQPPPVAQGFAQQQQYPRVQQQVWQPEHQIPPPVLEDQAIQAPRPINGQTGITAPQFVSDPSPTSQPVSPVHNRNSMSFPHKSAVNRTGSVSSIALGAIHSQRAGNRTSSPATSIKIPPPPGGPPPQDPTAFSALGFGGPSDWEHFGGVGEIDDEEMFGVKKEVETGKGKEESVELPAHVPSPPPSPPSQPQGLNVSGGRRDTYQPTPPPGLNSGPPPQPQGFVMGEGVVQPTSQSPQTSQGQFPVPQRPISQFGVQQHNSRESSRHGTPNHHQEQYQPPPNQSTPAQHHGQYQPPPNQHGFAVQNNSQGNSRHGTPAQQQSRLPPSSGNTIVMDNGGWAPQNVQGQQRQQTPSQQNAIQHPPTQWGTQGQQQQPQHPAQLRAQEHTPTEHSGWAQQDQHQDQSLNLAAELRAKDEAFERLKHDAEKEKADLHIVMDRIRADAQREQKTLNTELERLKGVSAELEKLRSDLENAKAHAASIETGLNQQIEVLKVAGVKEKTTFEAVNKEKVSTIERLKEDAEGKDDAIKERDATIADLKRQLETEKSKPAPQPIELPQPTPGDLIPDIDPWYAGSLERYIGMLRGEAGAQQIEDKIGIFTNFLRAESGIRGLEYYSAPPPPVTTLAFAPPAAEVSIGSSREAWDSSAGKQDLKVQVPQQQPPQDDFQYSPGGRPLLQHKSMPSTDSVKGDHPITFVSQPEQLPPISTAHEPQRQAPILTPTSSTDEKGPVQSPPDESIGQYRAFVPPAISQSESANFLHRQSISFTQPAFVAPLHTAKPSKGHDEIFFSVPHEQQQSPNAKLISRPTTSASVGTDIPLPAPLSFTPAPLSVNSQAAVPSSKNIPAHVLNEILPAQIVPATPHPRLEGLWKNSAALPSDFAYITAITADYDKSAILTRKKNDAARHKREEESEEHNDQLFNDNEISYADIGNLEDEFKEKERELKAQEDREEYKMYVEQVFDKVYDRLQGEIKGLMDIYIEAENFLQISVSGVKVIGGNSDVPSTYEALQLLKDLHEKLELRHEKVAQAVAERDKRYKRTEVQPLYAKGDIRMMRTVERHFENAEKQAAARSKDEHAHRIGELVRVVEEVVIAAVGSEQDEADHILDAAKTVAKNDPDRNGELLKRARDTLLAIKKSSVDLLTLFNTLEISHNSSQLEAELAQVKAQQTVDPNQIQELETEMANSETQMKEEFKRRVGVLEQDKGEIEALVKEPLTGEQKEAKEKERRLKMALEEAKRRNGQM